MSQDNKIYYEMMLCIGAAHSNFSLAQKLYRERYIDGKNPPNRILPSNTTFSRLATRLYETGSFIPAVERIGPQNDHRILEYFEKHPDSSLRKAAKALNISACSISQVLRRNDVVDDEDYYKHVVNSIFKQLPNLTVNDCEIRLKFSQWYQRELENNINHAFYILWTDEVSFTKFGIASLHDSHILAQYRQFKQQWRINVWAGVIGNQIIGPFFLPYDLNAENYLTFLSEVLEEKLEDLPLNIYLNIIFQHAGTSSHFSEKVKPYLRKHFKLSIYNTGNMKWPKNSEDLTPTGFFLWPYFKSTIYSEMHDSKKVLKEKIISAFDSITTNMLQNVQKSLSRRMSLCVEHHGKHIEPFL